MGAEKKTNVRVWEGYGGRTRFEVSILTLSGAVRWVVGPDMGLQADRHSSGRELRSLGQEGMAREGGTP